MLSVGLWIVPGDLWRWTQRESCRMGGAQAEGSSDYLSDGHDAILSSWFIDKICWNGRKTSWENYEKIFFDVFCHSKSESEVRLGKKNVCFLYFDAYDTHKVSVRNNFVIVLCLENRPSALVLVLDSHDALGGEPRTFHHYLCIDSQLITLRKAWLSYFLVSCDSTPPLILKFRALSERKTNIYSLEMSSIFTLPLEYTPTVYFSVIYVIYCSMLCNVS